ncbi:MAG: hypothetical protein H2172_03990 [Opitutus sp.]|nr:hypothetical protein [Opitutus sp.]MCS6246388.1 hypothetical protein [Opitutus sp.]MCS6273246.1 hypothetical protein [Opitutus sp.]MCS6277978.1 hypothetical protein [Opitutus sp.]MCS6298915.1 hypothetical protein [Opitutus sp.]
MNATLISRGSAKSSVTTDTTLAEAIAEIASDTHRALVEKIRSAPTKEQADELKKTLPAFLFSGTFKTRKGTDLIQHSGLIPADLDKLNRPDLERVVELAKGDPHAAAYFVSPGGNGLKIIHRCDPNDHAAAYRSMEAHVRSRYGIAPDPTGKDVNRLCFASYDPTARINPNATPLPTVAATVVAKPVLRADPVAAPITRGDDIMILPSREGLSISESAAAIFARIGPTNTLFSRGGLPHEVGDVDGVAELRLVDSNAFRSRLDGYGRVMSHRSGRNDTTVLAPAICSVDTARALLASKEANDALPAVAAVLAAPVIAVDGLDVLILGKGYHPQAGGLFITGGDDPPDVPLVEAVERLHALLADFDFPSPGDHARALASFVAPALRFGGILPALAPVDVAEADQSQAGKTYRYKLVAALYRETLNFVVQKQGGVGSLDEAIGERLITGKPFVVFDNLRGRVASTFFESALTAGGRVPCRVPHKGTVDVDIRPFCFGATSNGMEATVDLANRSVITRIRKRPPGYQFKKWPEGDLLDHVKANQAFYLGCIFTVVTEWLRQGRPVTGETRHDFRQWVQALDAIGQTIFKTAPIMDGHEAHKARVANPALSWLRQVALDLVAQAKTGWLTASQLSEVASDADIPIPGIRPEAADEDRARAIGRLMGKIFRETAEVEVDGLKVIRLEEYNEAHRGQSFAYRVAPCGNTGLRQYP